MILQNSKFTDQRPFPIGVPIDKTKYPIFAVLDSVWAKYPHLRGDCSGYLKKVAQELGVPMLQGNANDIVAWLGKQPGWRQLGHDPAKAAKLSAQGYFVVAGEQAAENGHVAIVVPGWASDGAPMGYWGKLNSVGKANMSLAWAWISEKNWNSPREQKFHPHPKGAPAPLDEVFYFAYPLHSLAPVK